MNKIKFLLCFVLLMSGVEGRGQIYINSYRFAAAVSDSLLLDFYPNASFAYSLRKLDKDYSGNVITVRRVNGDTSSIGFSGNYLDTVALKNFCGTASTDTCWVSRWIDQSGNNRHMISIVASEMPTILQSGALRYINGEVGIEYDGTNDYMVGDSFAFNTNADFTNFILFTPTRINHSSVQHIMDGDQNPPRASQFLRINTDNTWLSIAFKNSTAFILTSTSTATNNTSYLATNLSKSNAYELYLNNTLNQTVSTTGTTMPGTRIYLGARLAIGIGVATFYRGFISEVILYNTDKSTDRSGINTNINTFYSIY